MIILVFYTFFSLVGTLLAAPTWTTMTSSIHARHARMSPPRRENLNHSSNNGDISDLDSRCIHAAGTRNAKRAEATISFPKVLYGEFFEDLKSWESKESDKEKLLRQDQEVFRQNESNTSASPTPTKLSFHSPHMGPGLALAPSSSPSIKGGLSSSGVRKLIVIVTVFGVIGMLILGCFMVNEPHLLLWGSRKSRKASLSEHVRTKRKLVMTEKDRSTWTSKYLSPSPPGTKYLSPPSSSPYDVPPGLSTSSDRRQSTPPVQGGGLDISSDLQKSKWSMTTSDYGVSPRTSASTTGGQRQQSLGFGSIQLSHHPVLINPPQVYNPLASSSERNSDGSDYPFLGRYGHSRNQSAPVTPSIASSGSEWGVEGRSRSSSESSWRVPRVHWR